MLDLLEFIGIKKKSTDSRRHVKVDKIKLVLLGFALSASLSAAEINPYHKTIIEPFKNLDNEKPSRVSVTGLRITSYHDSEFGWEVEASTAATCNFINRGVVRNADAAGRILGPDEYMVVHYSSEFQNLAVGVNFSKRIDDFRFVYGLDFGLGRYSVTFPQFHEVYYSSGQTYSHRLEISKNIFDNVNMAIEGGYVEAVSPVMKNPAGNSLQGKLDYSGLSMGISISFPL